MQEKKTKEAKETFEKLKKKGHKMRYAEICHIQQCDKCFPTKEVDPCDMKYHGNIQLSPCTRKPQRPDVSWKFGGDNKEIMEWSRQCWEHQKNCRICGQPK